MKRIITIVAVSILAILALSGCTTHKSQSYTFKIDNGESIKVELDTSKGHSLTQKDGTFTVLKGDENMLSGMFTEWTLKEVVQTYGDPSDVVRSSDSEIVWKNGDEYDRVLKISDKTNVILGSQAKEPEDIEEIYGLLTFTVVDGEAADQETNESKQADENTPLTNESTADSANLKEASNTFAFHDLAISLPEGSVGREISDTEFNVAIDGAMVQFVYAPGTKDMTDGEKSAKSFVESQNGELINASSTTVAGNLAGTATYKFGNEECKVYIFTVNKNAYAIYSQNTSALDKIVNSISI